MTYRSTASSVTHCLALGGTIFMGGFFGVASKESASRTCSTAPTTTRTSARGAAAWPSRTASGFTRVHPRHHQRPVPLASSRTTCRKLHGRPGIGVISDYEDQPLIIGSHLGRLRHRHRRRRSGTSHELARQGLRETDDPLLRDERRTRSTPPSWWPRSSTRRTRFEDGHRATPRRRSRAPARSCC